MKFRWKLVMWGSEARELLYRVDPPFYDHIHVGEARAREFQFKFGGSVESFSLGWETAFVITRRPRLWRWMTPAFWRLKRRARYEF